MARATPCDQRAVPGERVAATQQGRAPAVEHGGVRYALRTFVRGRSDGRFAVEWELTIRNQAALPYRVPCPLWAHERIVGGGASGGPWPAPFACWDVTLARGQQTVLHIAQPDACTAGVGAGESVEMELGLDDGDVAVTLASATLTAPQAGGRARLRLHAPAAALRRSPL